MLPPANYDPRNQNRNTSCSSPAGLWIRAKLVTVRLRSCLAIVFRSTLLNDFEEHQDNSIRDTCKFERNARFRTGEKYNKHCIDLQSTRLASSGDDIGFDRETLNCKRRLPRFPRTLPPFGRKMHFEVLYR